MRGRCNGCTVSGYSRIPGTNRPASFTVLSKQARQGLKSFDYYNSHDHNARLSCRHFDISPQTFYRWKRRYNPKHIEGLEDRPHRPKHLWQPNYSVELAEAVLRSREEYRRWGKDKQWDSCVARDTIAPPPRWPGFSIRKRSVVY